MGGLLDPAPCHERPAAPCAESACKRTPCKATQCSKTCHPVFGRPTSGSCYPVAPMCALKGVETCANPGVCGRSCLLCYIGAAQHVSVLADGGKACAWQGSASGDTVCMLAIKMLALAVTSCAKATYWTACCQRMALAQLEIPVAAKSLLQIFKR